MKLYLLNKEKKCKKNDHKKKQSNLRLSNQGQDQGFHRVLVMLVNLRKKGAAEEAVDGSMDGLMEGSECAPSSRVVSM